MRNHKYAPDMFTFPHVDFILDYTGELFHCELRLHILLQLNSISSQEFHTTELSYLDRETDEVRVVRILNEGDRTGKAF